MDAESCSYKNTMSSCTRSLHVVVVVVADVVVEAVVAVAVVACIQVFCSVSGRLVELFRRRSHRSSR